MGMYTGLRFKGYVKPEFREEFKRFTDMSLDWQERKWDKFSDPVLQNYSKIERASFIPYGALAYMPDDWQTNTDEYGDGDATDGFERTFNPETGYWTFQCSLKNYSDTIEEFFKIIPHFIESVEHAEVFYEVWDWSEKYELINNQMKMTNNQFVRYNYYNED